MWQVVFTKQAQKDAKKLSASGLRPKAEKLIKILRENPFETHPPCEKLLGILAGAVVLNFSDFRWRYAMSQTLKWETAMKEAYETLSARFPENEWTKRAYPYRLL